MKPKFYKNGAAVTFERLFPSGMYLVELWRPDGSLHDKIRCDDYREATCYARAFGKVAQTMQGAEA